MIPPFWRALADCETGGRWNWGELHRPGEGRTYEGGVGFYWSTWDTWARHVGVYRRFPEAWMAPPAVQIRVARYGLSAGGYWGCLHEHPSILSLPGA